MKGLRWTTLPADERNDFLNTGGTGVLTFATEPGEPPASLPVSYGFYDDDELFYFQLSFPPGTHKPDVIENPISFVTYGETDEGWRSVVATGTLDELADAHPESVTVQGMWAVEIPTIDVFDRPREDIEFHDFFLDPDRLTGRKSVPE